MIFRRGAEGRTVTLNQLQVAWLERSCEDGRGGSHICSHSAGSLRIIAAAKDPYCAYWSDQFTVDIRTRKEYKEGITKR